MTIQRPESLMPNSAETLRDAHVPLIELLNFQQRTSGPMCIAAMRLAGVKEVVYACSNDDGAPYGLSTAAIYADLARPFSEQSMTIRHVPVRLESHPDLYAEWKRRQEGQI